MDIIRINSLLNFLEEDIKFSNESDSNKGASLDTIDEIREIINK